MKAKLMTQWLCWCCFAVLVNVSCEQAPDPQGGSLMVTVDFGTETVPDGLAGLQFHVQRHGTNQVLSKTHKTVAGSSFNVVFADLVPYNTYDILVIPCSEINGDTCIPLPQCFPAIVNDVFVTPGETVALDVPQGLVIHCVGSGGASIPLAPGFNFPPFIRGDTSYLLEESSCTVEVCVNAQDGIGDHDDLEFVWDFPSELSVSKVVSKREDNLWMSCATVFPASSKVRDGTVAVYDLVDGIRFDNLLANVGANSRDERNLEDAPLSQCAEKIPRDTIFLDKTPVVVPGERFASVSVDAVLGAPTRVVRTEFKAWTGSTFETLGRRSTEIRGEGRTNRELKVELHGNVSLAQHSRLLVVAQVLHTEDLSVIAEDRRFVEIQGRHPILSFDNSSIQRMNLGESTVVEEQVAPGLTVGSSRARTILVTPLSSRSLAFSQYALVHPRTLPKVDAIQFWIQTDRDARATVELWNRGAGEPAVSKPLFLKSHETQRITLSIPDDFSFGNREKDGSFRIEDFLQVVVSTTGLSLGEPLRTTVDDVLFVKDGQLVAIHDDFQDADLSTDLLVDKQRSADLAVGLSGQSLTVTIATDPSHERESDAARLHLDGTGSIAPNIDTLDLWIKASPDTSAVVAIHLRDDDNNTGMFEAADDEIWFRGGIVVEAGTDWQRVAIPLAEFRKISGNGNGALDLHSGGGLIGTTITIGDIPSNRVLQMGFDQIQLADSTLHEFED